MTTEDEDKALRYRRAQSVTRAEEISEQEKKVRRSQLDKPTMNSQTTGFTFLMEFRVYKLYWFVAVVPPVIALLIEKAIAVDLIPQKIGMSIQIANILFVVSLPAIVLHFKGDDFSFVIFLKLWSYTQTNYWCRCGTKRKLSKNTLRRQSLSAPTWSQLVNAEQDQSFEDEKNEAAVAVGLVKYPDNLNLKDLFYFLLAPTLCYELNFPRTARIRKRFLVKRLLEVVFGLNLVLALFQQWMIPSVTNSIDTFSTMDPIRITERLLKLAVPNHLIWLCFFYLSFHSFLNLMGELLQFADRNFYNDWWNANNISVFWSTWNMPVHMWAVRHVYIPITKRGHSKVVASIVVFFISAFFHEYLVSVPLQMFRIWAFLGMMAQPPLSVISRMAEIKLGPRWGNLIVWSSLILGQPLAIMMYYHDYALLHFTPAKL
ncbi:hypothetical protein O3G_MSEX009402 [Manduca sexta]|uniref:O-acyltransferase n=1 Tax=Manduca sexta TaxID=7130 RepID=A0A922CRT6_MANSE|nr:hypothetical protein O3G_MSEX009402 [Manduca sexta]